MTSETCINDREAYVRRLIRHPLAYLLAKPCYCDPGVHYECQRCEALARHPMRPEEAS